MASWWNLGEHSGYPGSELALWQIVCPFCDETGNFALVHHAKKRQPNREKYLNYDTYRCGNCANLIMVFWSAGDNLHDYHMVPWRRGYHRAPDAWPEEVGRFWLQAKRNLADQNLDAAAVMARSSMQVALRDNAAVGNNLKQEIESLAKQGLLPPVMKDWSDELRFLGNDAAHPNPGGGVLDPRDVADAVEFLDYLLQYLYTLPERITRYRERDGAE